MFTEDVRENPTLLDQIPDDPEAIAIAISIEEREAERRYDAETPRTVATITAPTLEGSFPTSAGRRR